MIRLNTRHLSVLAYTNGFTLWHYKAPHYVLKELEQAEFFSGAAEFLAPGDMILISAKDGGKIACVASEGNKLIGVG